MNPVILGAIISGVVSASLSGVAAFFTVKIAIARLQVWQELIGPKIDKLEQDRAIHEDDIRAHDFELDGLLQRAGIARARRQVIR